MRAILFVASLPAILAARSTRADDPAAEFFEKEVRPVLVERCQSCHGEAKHKNGLRLDSRASALAGGVSGPAVVPGKPDESPLIDAINYGELQMPPKAKLPDEEIAALTKWVAIGAPWPGDGGTKAAAKVKPFDLAERAQHWSFRPVRDHALPGVSDPSWPRTPVDRFLLAALDAQGLKPAPDADRRTWLRRVTFDLIGLPPRPAEIDAFLNDDSPAARARVVDRLLASPHYGERWGRHWLDLVRFAETAGHEFDYDIPNAHRYRDYVIRALNADLPYRRFVVEHVAGDLLDDPRRHPAEGFNESILGTGFFFLGEGTHSPVDVRDDQVQHVDNRIDVMGKAFLGLTIACARCHDHKFDPITQKDYYALAGYLRSSRHQQAFIDPPDRIGAHVAELQAIKEAMRPSLGPFDAPGESRRPEPDDAAGLLFEDFDKSTYENWSATGDAFGDGPTRPGDFRLRPDGDGAPVAPGWAHSGLASDRLQGVLRSQIFTIHHKYIHYLAAGKGGRINVVVDGFEKIRDPIYGALALAVDAGESPKWYAQDVSMWLGHTAYIELADGATTDYSGAVATLFPGDGFLAVDEIRFSDRPTTPDAPAAAPAPTRRPDPALLARHREVEARIPAPTLALAVIDGTGEDERVMLRGSYKTPGPVVPRRFLEAIAGPDQPAPTSGSGRLNLARRMVDPSDPLIARVLVNRVWKHHFGAGIVRTPDDFGAMGEPPTHPELLDWLANEFIREGWSIKHLHRLLTLSRAYGLSSRPDDPEAERLDPDNRLYHRMNIRRLEAEAIRDAMLAVSGRLDRALFGPSVPPHLTPFMQGRGRPKESGPLDGDGRRSLYLNVRRNFPDPMLTAFDLPPPATTMGRRNASNVPAQALTMLNDPFVLDQSRRWAARILRDGSTTDARIAAAYLAAFGRPPTADERSEAGAFLDSRPDDPAAWADLCHVLLNVKGFLFVD